MTVIAYGSQPYSILRDKAVCEPPNWPTVSLSEALSWIAFKNSKNCNALNSALVTSPVEDLPDARSELAEAVAKLANLGQSGIIELTGKYIEHFDASAGMISRAVIPANDLRHFRQFDLINDGLRRGNGFAYRSTTEGYEWRVEANSRDFYDQVEVDRAALTGQFPPPSLELMTDQEVLQWCRDWISSGKGNGMDKAWLAFKILPRALGLSRDEVFRRLWKKAKTKTG